MQVDQTGLVISLVLLLNAAFPCGPGDSADGLDGHWCVVRDFNSGHQLVLPPAKWCPIFVSRTAQGPARCGQGRSGGKSGGAG